MKLGVKCPECGHIRTVPLETNAMNVVQCVRDTGGGRGCGGVYLVETETVTHISSRTYRVDQAPASTSAPQIIEEDGESC